MDKKTGIDWVGMNKCVGDFIAVHPLAMIADWVNDNPSTHWEDEAKIWDAGVMLMSGEIGEGADRLSQLTGVTKIVWLHFWSMWEAHF